MIPGLASLFTIGVKLIDELYTSDEEKAEQFAKLTKLQQDGNLEQMKLEVGVLQGQMSINAKEAEHSSVFVAGARPFIIWVGGFSLAWSGVIHPLLTWAWAFAAVEGTPPPMIDSSQLMAIVSGLLGVGGMRSYDKVKGTNTKQIKL